MTISKYNNKKIMIWRVKFKILNNQMIGLIKLQKTMVIVAGY